MSNALQDVILERARQREKGYTESHDDEHTVAELALAAASYAFSNKLQPAFWPWEEAAWNPKDERSNLICAAALLIAAAELYDRKKARAAK